MEEIPTEVLTTRRGAFKWTVGVVTSLNCTNVLSASLRTSLDYRQKQVKGEPSNEGSLRDQYTNWPQTKAGGMSHEQSCDSQKVTRANVCLAKSCGLRKGSRYVSPVHPCQIRAGEDGGAQLTLNQLGSPHDENQDGRCLRAVC